MDEKIFETANSHTEVGAGTATSTGVIIKSFIGVLIAFAVAMPRLATGNYFGEFFFSGGFLTDIFGMIIFTVVVGVIWFSLTRALLVNKGAILNALIFGLASVFSGLFLANALIVAVSWIDVYADVNITMVVIALKLTAITTFIGVVAGILILPKIQMTGRVVKFAQNAALIVMGLAMASFIMVIIGLLFAAFGMPGVLNMWGSIFYGVGPISILLSIFLVIFAEFLFLGTLAFVKYGIGRVPKYQEYYLSIVMVNGILRLYIEIFKLVLKLLASRNRN